MPLSKKKKTLEWWLCRALPSQRLFVFLYSISYFRSHNHKPPRIAETPGIEAAQSSRKYIQAQELCNKAGCFIAGIIIGYLRQEAESGFTKFRFQAMTQYPEKSDQWGCQIRCDVTALWHWSDFSGYGVIS